MASRYAESDSEEDFVIEQRSRGKYRPKTKSSAATLMDEQKSERKVVDPLMVTKYSNNDSEEDFVIEGKKDDQSFSSKGENSKIVPKRKDTKMNAKEYSRKNSNKKNPKIPFITKTVAGAKTNELAEQDSRKLDRLSKQKAKETTKLILEELSYEKKVIDLSESESDFED